MKNKQRIVNYVSLSTLSFAFVAGFAVTGHAQQQLPTQLVSNESGANMTSGNVNTTATEESIVSQPVAVSNQMRPRQAPRAEESMGFMAGEGGISLSGTPSTGIGGSNTGSANTGGTQIQNVTVQSNPEATSVSQSESSFDRADMLRKRRMQREIENETRLLERLEAGRLTDERAREGAIEGYDSTVSNGAAAAASAYGNGYVASAAAAASASSGMVSVPVTSTGSATAIATATSSGSSDGFSLLGMGSFKLVPFAGYRWYDNRNAYFYDAQNRITAGLTLEGVVSKNVSIEGTFTYGRDVFNERFGMLNGGFGAFGNQGNFGQNACLGGGFVCQARARDTFEVSGGLKLGHNFGKFRPYIAGSLGGMLSMYDIDHQGTNIILEQAGLNRSSTQFLGNFGGGFDFGFSQSLSAGARFDYQASLNRNNTMFDQIWGDNANRFRLTGSLQLQF